MSRYLSTTSHTHTEDHAVKANRARTVVIAKGVFDVFLAWGIMFLPIAVYDGPAPAFVSKYSGLQFIYRDADPGGAYAIAALIMGCGIAALSAGISGHESAYMTIATLNGAFAYTGLLGCLFSPKKFGSSVLLLAALQGVAWFFLIVNAGGYTIGETIGLKAAVERAHKKKEQFEHDREKRHDREREMEFEKHREKERHEREGYGSTGTGGGVGQEHVRRYTGSGGQHRDSAGAGYGGTGSGGYGTSAQQGGITGQERYSGAKSGLGGEFGGHGLKTEKIRGAQEHQ